MTDSTQGGVPMFQIDPAAIGDLHDEICRYLDALDVFRREGCEPIWGDAPVPEEVLP